MAKLNGEIQPLSFYSPYKTKTLVGTDISPTNKDATIIA